MASEQEWASIGPDLELSDPGEGGSQCDVPGQGWEVSPPWEQPTCTRNPCPQLVSMTPTGTPTNGSKESFLSMDGHSTSWTLGSSSGHRDVRGLKVTGRGPLAPDHTGL